jgi:plasmid stabilization system protein ParE
VKKPRVAFSDAAIADILEQSDWYEAQADRSLAQRWEEAVTATLLRIV